MLRIQLVAIALLVVIAALPASGQQQSNTAPPPNIQAVSLDILVEEFQAEVQKWVDPISKWATRLLFMLFVASLIWRLGEMLFGTPDLGETLKFILFQILTIGFYLVCIQNIGAFSTQIIEGFGSMPGLVLDELQDSGQTTIAPGGNIGEPTPSNVLAHGWTIANKLWNMPWSWSVSVIVFPLVGLCIAVIYSVIAAFVVLVLVEGYMIIGLGVICLGLGGSDITNSVAVRYLWYIVGFGAKMFALYAIIGIGTQITANVLVPLYNSQDVNQILAACPIAICVPLLLAFLCYVIPAQMQQLLSGTSSPSNSAMTVMLQAATFTAMSSLGKIFQASTSAAGNVGKAAGMASRSMGGAGGVMGTLRSLGSNPAGMVKGTAGNLMAAAKSIPPPNGSMQAALKKLEDSSGSSGG